MDELLDGEDRALVVEEHEIPPRTRADADGNEDDEVAAVGDAPPPPVVAAIMNAAQSPPFMTAKRIVVIRAFERLTVDEAGPVVDVLADPLETTVLVFVSGGGKAPKNLADALKGATTVGAASEKTADVLMEELARTQLTFRNDASKLVLDHLGEDAGRVGALLDVLAATFGPGTTLTAAEVEPYLGELGSVRVFELTNRVEEGDVAGALETLHRMLTVTSPKQPKPMHPLQVMAMLQSRYRKLLRLDDPAIRSVDEAHAALGGGKGSTFPAKKALDASRALGTDGLRRAVDQLHRADLELKGASALPEDAVMEVLVARLAALHGRTRGTGRRRPERAAR